MRLLVSLSILCLSLRTIQSVRNSKCTNEGTVWDSRLRECLQIANDTLTFLCKSDLQCTMSKLGELSYCSPESGLCECHDRESEGRRPTTHYNGVCYLKKNVDDFCSTNEECEAGIHPHAICTELESLLPGEKVCLCPDGKSCRNLGDNCKTDQECQDGINQYAECQFRIGENVCVCTEGHVCELVLEEDEGMLSRWEIAGIVLGVIGGLVVVVLVVVFILRRRKVKYFV